MLQSFKVTNHRSLRDEQELVLVPVYDKTLPAATVAGIFGPNASGKSNLLDALKLMGALVRHPYRTWGPGAGIARHPFRLDPDALAAPSTFQIDVILEDVRYVYGISVDDERVREEWLYRWPAGRRQRVFERDTETVRLGSTLKDYRSRQIRLREETRENVSVLATSAYLNHAEVRPVYDWLGTQLRSAGRVSAPADHPSTRRMFDDEKERSRLVSLLRAADLGIDDVQIVEMPQPVPRFAEAQMADMRTLLETELQDEERARIEQRLDFLEQTLESERTRPEFVFRHGGASFTVGDESEGTRAWLSTLLRALDVLRDGSLMIVDEIDSSLHPRLTTQLIRLFQDRQINPNLAQLVFTSHDAVLLGTMGGRDVLRRDEIWFIDKDKSGASTLYPLTDFQPRKLGENLVKRYLGGSYGAVPNVFESDFREALGLDPWEGEDEDGASTR